MAVWKNTQCTSGFGDVLYVFRIQVVRIPKNIVFSHCMGYISQRSGCRDGYNALAAMPWKWKHKENHSCLLSLDVFISYLLGKDYFIYIYTIHIFLKYDGVKDSCVCQIGFQKQLFLTRLRHVLLAEGDKKRKRSQKI